MIQARGCRLPHGNENARTSANETRPVVVSQQMSSFSRSLVLAVTWSALALSGFAKSSAPQTATPAPPSLLPTDFAGWHLSAPAQHSTAPEAADPANAPVLKEDGFQEFTSGTYTRGGEKMSVRAIRFEDASGAYAAYTFYRRPGMPKEDIGQGGAFDGTRVLFWQGATVVDATLDHLTAMSAAELRELAGDLPRVTGNAAVLPPLIGYLPQTSLDKQTTRYALGPSGYTRGGGVLPSSLVDFDRGAETISAQYAVRGSDGTLTIISYPTPQLAANREDAIRSYLSAGNTAQAQWPQGLADSAPSALQTRRSGTLVAVTSGNFPEIAARDLLNQVNYVADVTWNNPQGYVSDAAKTARLIIGIFVLTGILAGSAIILGFFLGGGRVLYRRIRGKPASSVSDNEFITLHLE